MSLKTAATYFNNKVSFLGRTISKSTISRILKKHSLRPHLHKYFLQITDPQFFSKMALLVNLYLKRPKYLFCFDECPGLQALKRLAPSLQAKKGHVKLSEPNHNRMGTTDLYAFLDVNTGKIFGVCTQNHKVKTLIRVFKRHFKSLPIIPKDKDTVIYYICDNLSNHSCHEFCRFIAKLCEIEYPEKKLNTKQKRQKWLQCENKKIVITFTPKHGSWLNMVEIWFGVLSKMCLKHNSFDSVAQLKTVIERFMKTWNKYFAHPFQWKYKGEGLHGKAVRRFIQHICIENPDMKESFLCTQIELMIELFKNNLRAVDINDWKLLAKTIEEKKTFIETCIKNAQKPRVKKKLLAFFPQLMELLIENNFLKLDIAA